MKFHKNKRNSKYQDYLEGGESEKSSTSESAPVVGDAIQFKPLEVKIFGNNFDRAFKAFRSLVQKERILSVYKEKQSFEKPSDKKRRKRKESKRKFLDFNKK